MIEKIEKSRITVEKTFYYSDDGVIRSDNKDKVLKYEKLFLESHAARLYTTEPLCQTEEDLSDWELYTCNTKEEFLATLNSLCAAKRVLKRDIVNAKTVYTQECRFYAFRLDAGWNVDYELEVVTLPRLIESYKNEIAACNAYVDNLKQELEIFNRIIKL